MSAGAESLAAEGKGGTLRVKIAGEGAEGGGRVLLDEGRKGSQGLAADHAAGGDLVMWVGGAAAAAVDTA
jgi:hypothetical protein